jgi:DNA-binding CsgD family transcriptional regulator
VLSFPLALEGSNAKRVLLTPTERRVAALVIRGQSTAAITRARGTSPRTIAKQLVAIYAKLGVRSRRDAPRRVGSAEEDHVSDPIAILESAYDLAGDERQWLQQIMDAARRENAPHGDWVTGITYDAAGSGAVVERVVGASGLDDRTMRAMSAQVSLPKAEEEKLAPIYRNVFVGPLRGSSKVLRRAGVDEERLRAFEQGLDQYFRLWGIADSLWVNAQDPTAIGCLLTAARRRAGAIPAQELHRWRYVAVHLATAFRVRRQLEGWSPDVLASERPGVEAIFSPGGALEHALKPAKSHGARAALGHAVKALDRARGSLRRHDPDEAIAIWHAMVAGRWSLLDHVDSDGRRYILAHRNDPRVPDARGLTLRERQVTAYAALGHSNKVIAYELGLSTSTVGNHLARARAKLALPSATPLRELAGEPVGHGRKASNR